MTPIIGATLEHPIVITELPFALPYVWMDQTPGGSNLGRAEFIFCPIFRKGKIVSMNFQRRQQREIKRFYRVDGMFSDAFRFHSCVDIKYAPWHYSYCKDHRTVSMWIYVPRESKELFIDEYSSVYMSFEFR